MTDSARVPAFALSRREVEDRLSLPPDTDRMPVQDRSQRKIRSVPRALAEAAYEGYAFAGHSRQSFERLHERGGFGMWEVAYYLAQAVEAGWVRFEYVGAAGKPRQSTAASQANARLGGDCS